MTWWLISYRSDISQCWSNNQAKVQKTEAQHFRKTLHLQTSCRQKTPIKEIAFDYHLSKTAIKCILKNTKEIHLNKTSMSSRTKTMLMTSSLVQDKIRLFLDLSRNPITAKEVWTFLFKETGIRLEFT